MATKKKEPPVVRTKSRGQVTSTLERFAEIYRGKFPARDVRYVYDPTHKPELSGVLGRQAVGYQFVTMGELGVASTSDDENKPLRVGDLILMSIDKETKKALQEEQKELAVEQRLSVDRQYREALDAAAEAERKEGSRAPMKPIGSASIDMKEKEYEFEQREEEK